MELNREQIIKICECCVKNECDKCPIFKEADYCIDILAPNIIALIKQLTEENTKLQVDYNELYEENERLRAEGEWISVNDGLPKNGLARVLVALLYNEFTQPIGFNKIDTDRYIDGKWVRWGNNVTHWRELPTMPETKGEWYVTIY